MATIPLCRTERIVVERHTGSIGRAFRRDKAGRLIPNLFCWRDVRRDHKTPAINGNKCPDGGQATFPTGLSRTAHPMCYDRTMFPDYFPS